MKHLKNRITELRGELSKYQSKTSENSNRKIRLQDIQCDDEKIKKLFKKPKMKKKWKYYCDDYYNSDETDVESDNSAEDGNDSKSENNKINTRKKNNIKIKKNMKQPPQKRKKQRKNKRVYINNWL